ncbi:hypothetical protein [Dryocola sp. BD586]|uniref:hypothetical protein n=1 Tax=Dryocola sp. BD586 TaxID=3133271 RepID=UPI003F505DC3
MSLRRASAPVAQPQIDPQAEAEKLQAQRLQECRKELDAMQVYNKASYNKYQAEFQKLSASTDKYLRVKEAIGADVNDILTPQKEFQTRELCFRIKSRLVQLMIRKG